MASTIILTTGVPGSGKSYVRCSKFIVDYYLLNSDGMHISNFPVNKELIADEVVRRANFLKLGFFAKITAPFRRKQHKVTREEVLSRIKVIPDEVLQSWRREDSGPWDFFEGVDLTESHIAIDEVHNFISSTKSPAYIAKWDEFLGEIRHRGCTFEGLTQDIMSVDAILKNRAGIRLELVPADTLRDPYFSITMSDWYELKASFTGVMKKCVFEREYQRRFSRWACLHTRKFFLEEQYFKYYNSYNASLAEKEKGEVNENRAPKCEFQKRTKLSLVTWFYLKNFLQITTRLGIAVFVIWLCFFGGATFFLTGFLGMTKSMVKSQKVENKTTEKTTVKTEKKTAIDKLNFSSNGQGQGTTEEKQVIEYINVKDYDVSPFQDEQQIMIYVGDQKRTEADIKKLNKEIEELRRENEKGYMPVFFNEAEIFLKNGMRIYAGYKFTEGEFKNLEVKSISLKDRCYYLSNDKCFRMP